MRIWRRRRKTAGETDARTPSAGSPVDVKTHIPAPRREWIGRSRLVSVLTASRGTRLVLVSAPAGFGKSTLIAEWRATPAESRAFAWVSLDEADNDPVSLWTTIVAALDGVIAGLVGDHLTRPLRNETPDVERGLLPRLLNALATLHPPVVLVLDDFHVLYEPRCHRQIETFVDRLPPTVQLVVATRTDPMLPLARYRAAGDILELRMSDLRFTRQEVALFVRRIAGIRLSDGDLDDLVEVAEGWPAAIYLAALSLRIDAVRGMDITLVTTAKTDDEGRALLKLLGFPFKEN